MSITCTPRHKRRLAVFSSMSIVASLAFGGSSCAVRQNGEASSPYLAHRTLWRGAETIYYCIDDSFGAKRPKIHGLVKASIADWQKYGHFTYLERACDGRQKITVTMTEDPQAARGSAHFPNAAPGPNVVLTIKLVEGHGQLLSGGELREDRAYGVILHEIGHTLGFDHEHEGDRGTEITTQDNRSIMYYPFERGAWHGAGWDNGWDRARLSMLDKIGVMTVYPPEILANPVNATPEVLSEEQTSSSCGAGQVAIGLACYGRYCDDLRLFCAGPRRASAETLSREDRTPPAAALDGQAPASAFVTGLSCRGPWCAEVSMQKSTFENLTPSAQCYDSAPISENPGSLGQDYHHICQKDHAITDLTCQGQYCSTIIVRCCQAK